MGDDKFARKIVHSALDITCGEAKGPEHAPRTRRERWTAWRFLMLAQDEALEDLCTSASPGGHYVEKPAEMVFTGKWRDHEFKDDGEMYYFLGNLYMSIADRGGRLVGYGEKKEMPDGTEAWEAIDEPYIDRPSTRDERFELHSFLVERVPRVLVYWFCRVLASVRRITVSEWLYDAGAGLREIISAGMDDEQVIRLRDGEIPEF